MKILAKTPSSATLSAALAGALFLFLPIFHFRNLLHKGPVPADAVYSFPEEDGPSVGGSLPARDALRAALPAPDRKRTTLFVDSEAPGGSVQELFWEPMEGGEPRVLFRLERIRRRMFDLTSRLPADRPYVLGLRLLRGDGPIAVHRFVVRQTAVPFELPPVDAIASFLVFLFLAVRALSERAAPRTTAAFAAGTALAYGFSAAFALPTLTNPWFWVLSSSLLLGWRALDKTRFPAAHASEWLGPVLAVAVILRWDAFLGAFGHPLTEDPLGYLAKALALDWSAPFDNGIREPFYIWVQSAFTALAGPNEFQFRLATFLFSVGSVLLTHRLARRLSGQVSVGLLAAFCLSWNRFAVYASMTGERTELFNLLVLSFCLAVAAAPRTFWAEVRLSLIGAAVSLTWLLGAAGCALIYASHAFLARKKWRYVAAAALTGGAATFPYFHSQQKIHGDAFIALNAHASFYRKTELGASGDDGARKVGFDYILKEHGAVFMIRRTLRGYVNLLFNPTNRFNKVLLGFHHTQAYSFALFPFYVAGLVHELFKKRVGAALLLLCLLNVSPYYLNELIDPRYLFFAAPFFAYFLSVGAVSCLVAALSRGQPSGTAPAAWTF